MGINKKILLETIKSKIFESDERCSDYRSILLESVATIYHFEVMHKSRQINIDQKVHELIKENAKLIDSKNDN